MLTGALFSQKLLMIVFGWPKFCRRFDLRHNWIGVTTTFINLCHNLFSGSLLIWRMIKNSTAIIFPNIRTLSINLGWVMHLHVFLN